MNDNDKQFENFVRQVKFDDTPDPNHRDRLEQDLLRMLTKQAPQQTEIWRIIMKSRITKFAAAAAIVITLMAGIAYFSGPIDMATRAFADVAEQLRTARTLTYTVITSTPIEGMATMRMQIVFKEPGYIRVTMPGGFVLIIDQMQKRGLSINALRKEFTEMDLSNLSADPSQISSVFSTIEKLRTLPDRADEALGVKEADGRSLRGFRVSEEGLNKIVWVDAKTWELVRVETEFANALGPHTVMTDFQFNVNLDESVFTLTPPEGYRRQKIQVDMSESTEVDLIKMLRSWGTCTKEGLFPPTLNPMELTKAAMKMQRNGKFSENLGADEMQQLALQTGRGMNFVMQMKPENDWHYAGKGVKLGDANAAIFWYRPEGSATYRVVYGDLSVKDMAPENLPK